MKLSDPSALEWFRNTVGLPDALVPVRVQDDDEAIDEDEEDEDEDEDEEDDDEIEDAELDEDDEAADEDADDEELEEEASGGAPNGSPRRLFWTPAAWSRC